MEMFKRGNFFSQARKVAASFVLVTALTAASPGEEPSRPGWNSEELVRLEAWIAKAPEDGLPAPDTQALERARTGSDPAAVDREATALALRLARMHLLGAVPPAERAGWHVRDPDEAVDLGERLAHALAVDSIDSFFEGLRPVHPDYATLRSALARETDPKRRRTIALNMDRWRWLPRMLGSDYVLVNAAAFEAHLWRQGREAGVWRVVVGKRSTPTPAFSATITGVILNPWWVVPASIVTEKHGVFPARDGYVRSGGQIRQKPGPTNALGAMKLDMPNPFTVYMHDTPSKQLFKQDVRAFSHGCIRVGDALGFAAALLDGVRSRSAIDAVVKTRVTTTVPLARAMPVYVTYFTAGSAADGRLAFYPDIYGRDGRSSAEPAAATECATG